MTRGLRIGRRYGVDPLAAVPVGRIMSAATAEVDGSFMVTASDTALRAVELMLDHQVDRVPVVDADGHPIGTVTTSDLLKAREEHRHHERGQHPRR